MRGIVRVGSFQTVSLHLLLPAVAELRGTHPDVEVQLVEAETEPGLEALRSHALDLAKRGALIVVNDLGGASDGTGHSETAAQKVVDEVWQVLRGRVIR